MHCMPIRHISFNENFLLFSTNKSYSERPFFDSINIKLLFFFPNFINSGIPKPLNVYKLYASVSKYNFSLIFGSILINTGLSSSNETPSYISIVEDFPNFFFTF